MVRNTENTNPVQDAIDRLTKALIPFGEGVANPPEIDIRVSWLDVSTADSGRFVPIVELSGEQRYPLDFNNPA